MDRRKVLIVIGIVVILLLGILVINSRKQSNGPKLGPEITGCTSAKPSNDSFIAAIKKLPNTDQSAKYSIVSVTEPTRCWNVVTVMVGDAVQSQTAIIQRVGNNIYASAPPSTSFPQGLMDKLSVPDAVQKAIIVYDDSSTSPDTESE